jgi:hypothetical protein
MKKATLLCSVAEPAIIKGVKLQVWETNAFKSE